MTDIVERMMLDGGGGGGGVDLPPRVTPPIAETPETVADYTDPSWNSDGEDVEENDDVEESFDFSSMLKSFLPFLMMGGGGGGTMMPMLMMLMMLGGK